MTTAVTALVDPVTAIAHMLSHGFVDDALVAGTFVALACGLVGHFLVLRDQVFTGDALSHVAFTGALGALAIGVDLRFGLFVGCVAVALLMGLVGPLGRAGDVVIGNVFAWLLGLGVFFLTIYTTSRSAGNGGAGTTVLFGSIFGMTRSQAGAAAAVGAGVACAVVAIARPLTFASLDPVVAAVHRVPVRALGLGFLALVGVAAGEATQVVGALLLLGLLATPAGAARQLSASPWRAMWLSAGIAVSSLWAGVAISYAAPSMPPSFSILAVATTWYAAASARGAVHRRAGRGGAHLAPDVGARGQPSRASRIPKPSRTAPESPSILRRARRLVMSRVTRSEASTITAK